jgi:hypothetical protein
VFVVVSLCSPAACSNITILSCFLIPFLRSPGSPKKQDVFTVVLTGYSLDRLSHRIRNSQCVLLPVRSGPCGGKSSSLSLLSEIFKGLGYDVYATPEVRLAASNFCRGRGRAKRPLPLILPFCCSAQVPTILMSGGAQYPGAASSDKKLLFAFEKALIDLQVRAVRSSTRQLTLFDAAGRGGLVHSHREVYGQAEPGE